MSHDLLRLLVVIEPDFEEMVEEEREIRRNDHDCLPYACICHNLSRRLSLYIGIDLICAFLPCIIKRSIRTCTELVELVCIK